jgi:hypothetical protein
MGESMDGEVPARWVEIVNATQELVMRRQAAPLWPVGAGSRLFRDDVRAAPWSISDAARSSMGAALDHLHALCVLVTSTGFLHVHAAYALARGCLENAAVALWIVSPEESAVRTERALRWYATDFRDSARAREEIGHDKRGFLDEMLVDLDRVDASTGFSGSVRQSLDHTQILRDVDALVPRGEAHLLFLWRVCSGFAHGRRWPALALVTDEQLADLENDDRNPRLTNSLDRLLAPTLAGFNLLASAIDTFTESAPEDRDRSGITERSKDRRRLDPKPSRPR